MDKYCFKMAFLLKKTFNSNQVSKAGIIQEPIHDYPVDPEMGLLIGHFAKEENKKIESKELLKYLF